MIDIKDLELGLFISDYTNPRRGSAIYKVECIYRKRVKLVGYMLKPETNNVLVAVNSDSKFVSIETLTKSYLYNKRTDMDKYIVED